MTVKFLVDTTRGSFPPETFTAGQVVDDRGPEWEAAMVRRKFAAYQRDGKLYDHEGNPVKEAAVETVVVNVADNRDEPEKGNLLEDGTPQRASSGPGEVMTTSVVTEGEAKKAPAHKSTAKK